MNDRVTALGRGRYLLRDGTRTRLAYAAVARGRTWVFLEGRVYIAGETEDRSVAPSGTSGHDTPQALAAPMPATVVQIAVKPGDRVLRGDVLLTLEAMKMELPIIAPRDGVVKSIACGMGDLVQSGVPLLELE